MTREEWIKIYNAKDVTWEKDKLIDNAEGSYIHAMDISDYAIEKTSN